MPEAFPRIYRGIREMVRREALNSRMARAIARKAGMKAGPSGTTVVAQPRPLGLLLAANNGTPQAAGAETEIRYDAVIENGGDFAFTPGSTSFFVIAGGLVLVTANLAVDGPSVSTFFGHAIVTESGEWAVMQTFHHRPSTIADPPARLVLGGSVGLVMGEGESASHVVFTDFGSLGDIAQNSEATRLYAELVA